MDTRLTSDEVSPEVEQPENPQHVSPPLAVKGNLRLPLGTDPTIAVFLPARAPRDRPAMLPYELEHTQAYRMVVQKCVHPAANYGHIRVHTCSSSPLAQIAVTIPSI